MTVANDSRAQIRPQPLSGFEQTIDRRLVHRAALAEVFLTGTTPASDSIYRATAQFPRAHAYYNDHLNRPAVYDPMLLLEVVRQAALAGAHEYFAVPFEHKFILSHQRLRVIRPEALSVGPRPGEIQIEVTTSNCKRFEGTVSGLDYAVKLFMHGLQVAEAGLGLRFRSPESYAALRQSNREGVAPLDTERFVPHAQGAPVTPYLVGRINPDNVIITDAELAGPTLQARLRVPAAHPSLFDHPQDHLPGMVLIEAARQMAVMATGEALGLAPTKLALLGIDAAYSRFGELEPDTLLEAVIGTDHEGENVPGARRHHANVVTVAARQDDRYIAEIALTVGRVAA